MLQNAFQNKQTAYQEYQKAKERTNVAYKAMQAAWDERSLAREIVNHEYDILQATREHNGSVWDEYKRTQIAKDSLIKKLRVQANREHTEMKKCFDQASDAYTSGDRSKAPDYSAKGYKHIEERDKLNAQIKAHIQEIRDAKSKAKQQTKEVDDSDFLKAKERFNDAKAKHEFAEAQFKESKAERNLRKMKFDSAQIEYARLKEELYAKLEEVRTA